MNEQDLKKIIEDQLALSRRLKAKIEAMEAGQHEPIAIVGMGFRLPGGIDSPNAYWDFLQGEGDALSDIPDNRPGLKAVFDCRTDQLGASYVNRAGFLADVEHFDAKFFGISAREAEALDPQQRLLLETSWEAMERAGIPVRRNERLNAGVFVGIMASEYPERRLGLKDKTTIDPYFGTGGGHCFAAGRISYAMGFSGPALSVDTACSSSLVALHLAARSLRNGECRYALVGGTNLIFSPDLMVSLCQSKALAPDGRSKTFTSEANGYGRGEGIGTLVLMPLADAEREGRPILAQLRGTAVNHDGASSGLTVPSGPAQKEVIAAALKDARCDPADIAYVEAHGTGTSLGDPIEIQALDATLGSAIAARALPLQIGNVKSRIGHLEAASGIAGVVKVVLSLRNGVIPPSLNSRDAALSPMIDWKNMKIEVPRRATSWPTAYHRRLAGVSSFGLSGTNAHAILEAWQADDAFEASVSAEELMLVSARDGAALHDLALSYAAQLKGEAASNISSLAHTSRVGRSIFPFRLAVTGANGPALAVALEQAAQSVAKLEAVKPGKPIYRPATAAAASLLLTHLDGEFPQISALAPDLDGDARLDAVLKAFGIRPQKEGLATDNPALRVAGKVLPLLGKTSSESRVLFLTALAALFTQGVDLKLEPLKASGSKISPDLPVYAFQRQRFWIDEPRHQMDPPPFQNADEEVLAVEGVSAERLDLLQFVERELRELLRTDDALDASMTFLDVGGDSFIAMLLKKTVEQRYEIDLPLDALATDVALETLYGRIADHVLSSACDQIVVAAE
ncbi:beta-ketoacyl synthase N-terminal-like domain-containing protein [Rhizobium sp.]|jgi:3-oxoacyl-[acyl-carrier-protein] synthase II|uniref:type I polyketide synthase n=1 Tax=Rhizobium sp. TaxID=391 RepID=UPI000E9CF5FD|nr:beta-ketoacyl synthase [Rhizobium sp.]